MLHVLVPRDSRQLGLFYSISVSADDDGDAGGACSASGARATDAELVCQDGSLELHFLGQIKL